VQLAAVMIAELTSTAEQTRETVARRPRAAVCPPLCMAFAPL